MKKGRIAHHQNVVLKALSHKLDDFYLVGGTALSLFYFQHRKSLDLDFFTRNLKYMRVKEIIEYLKMTLKVKVKITAQSLEEGKAKIVVCNIYFRPKDALKIDFVEDVVDLIKPPKVVEGMKILSLEDIYLRKIYAATGVVRVFDEIGRKKFVGGRQEAKDLYDLYFLSHTFMPVSNFADKYCNATIKEGLIRWFRTFDRMAIIDGILTLDINKKIDYKELEKHFKKEIDKIVEKQLGEV